MSKVTITGATGFVGNNLVRRLIDQGYDVCAIVRPKSSRRPFENLELEIVEGQLDDSATLDKAISSADYVVHAAGFIWFGRKYLEKSRQVNVGITRAIAEACRKHDCRLVHISSVDALANSKSPDKFLTERDLDPPKSIGSYTVSKREADTEVLNLTKQDLDALILHPSFMLGPWDWKPSSAEMLIAVVKGWIPFAPGGGFSVVDVRNVVDGIIASLEKGKTGQRYILAGTNMPYLELWQKFASLVDKSWPKWPMSDRMAKVIGFLGDVPYWLFRFEGHVNSPEIQVSQMYNYYSSKKAEEELSYSITSVDTAIHDCHQWLIEYGYLKK